MSNEPNEADLIRSLNDSVFPNCGDEISICPVCFHDYPEHEDDCKFIVALRKLAAHRTDESELAKALEEERRRCAMIAENLDDISTCPICPRDVAEAIRNNGNVKKG